MHYRGKERRIHKVFITRNSEYHVRAGTCVAVRSRRTGVWISNHEAIGMELEGNMPVSYFVGKAIWFLSSVARVKTSQVIGVLRPGREIVETYSLLWAVCPS